MSSLAPLDVLRIFLKHHDAYNNYGNNVNGSAPFFLDHPGSKAVTMIVRCGFDWKRSPEGLAYWSQLNLKWQALCKAFNITNQRAVP